MRSLNSHGVVAIRDREVSEVDVQHVVDAAKAVAIPADQKILHVLPQEFIIDGQEGIRDPIGMSGVRLEAKVHIVTGAESAANNIEKCIQRCGLEVDDIVLEQLASSFACLTEDETRARRLHHRHRRRHHGPRGVLAGGHSPHGGHTDCRRPGDQ